MAAWKYNFYCARWKHGEYSIELKKGYADNHWYYYKDQLDGNWWCIDPMTGMGVCTGKTRDDCINQANSEETLVKFNNMKKDKPDVYAGWMDNYYKALVEVNAFG